MELVCCETYVFWAWLFRDLKSKKQEKGNVQRRVQPPWLDAIINSYYH